MNTARARISTAALGFIVALAGLGAGLSAAVGERLSAEEGASILEYVVLVAVVVGVLALAVTNLGNSISGFVSRMVTKISALG